MCQLKNGRLNLNSDYKIRFAKTLILQKLKYNMGKMESSGDDKISDFIISRFLINEF